MNSVGRMRLGLLAISLTIGAASIISCGGSSGSGGVSANLSKVPGADKMLKTNSSTQALGIQEVGVQSYSGTPPNLKDISSSNADQYFWNGNIARITSQNSCVSPTDYRNSFWGQSAGGPTGQVGCQMAQTVGQAISQVLKSSSSTCYMKGMSSLNGQDYFSQQANDVNTLVQVTNMSNDGGGGSSMDVHITVFGTNTVGSLYKVQLVMCQGGSLTQQETITIDQSNGSYTNTNYQQQSGQNGSFNIQAFLVQNPDGSLGFDVTKDRIATMLFQQNGSTYGMYVDLTGKNQVVSKQYMSGSYNGNSMTNKVYSVADFIGTDINSFAFTEGATAMNFASTWGTNSYTGAAAYAGTYYQNVSSSADLTAVQGFSIAGDSFYTTAAQGPQLSITASCSGFTPTQTIPMDFSQTGVKNLQTTCEAANALQNFQACQGSSVQSAQNKCQQGS